MKKKLEKKYLYIHYYNGEQNKIKKINENLIMYILFWNDFKRIINEIYFRFYLRIVDKILIYISKIIYYKKLK